MKKRLVALTTLLVFGGAFAQDRADIDRTQIIGNRELPKVLYIVPWKKPLPGALAGRPLQSVLDEALAGMPIPKPMRWGSRAYGFARPLHWLVALFGDDVVAAKGALVAISIAMLVTAPAGPVASVILMAGRSRQAMFNTLESITLADLVEKARTAENKEFSHVL